LKEERRHEKQAWKRVNGNVKKINSNKLTKIDQVFYDKAVAGEHNMKK
jgi:hypothetical protein